MATLTIKSNLRYCEIRQYKKMFESMEIDEIPFTLYLNKKPFRTYVGFKYNNGFSDHLPIFLDLNFSKK